MEESRKLLDVIIKIILHSDIESFENLSESTNRFLLNRNYKEFLNFVHRSHSNYFLKLKNCDNNHCIECLAAEAETQQCVHEQRLTAYETNLLGFLIKKFDHVENNLAKNKKCRNCGKVFEANVLENRACSCPVCEQCLINAYSSRVIECVCCGVGVDMSQMQYVGEKLGIHTEIFGKCLGCELVFEESVLVDGICYLCERCPY